MMNFLKRNIRIFLFRIIGYELFEKQIFLLGVKFAFIQKKINKIKDLQEVEFSVFSQWGDDGILNWLTDNIPIKKKIFLEIGTQDYRESNTRFLLKYKNWEGYLVDANKKDIDNIKTQSIFWKYNLNLKHSFVTKKNINNIIRSFKLNGEIGLLSLDIDGVDYWIWKEINLIKPIIFVCEFNSTFGNKHRITVPYKQNFDRTKFHYSNLAFGASLKAFIKLSEEKGYQYIGTNSNGVNAYFIKKNYYRNIKKKIINISSYVSNTRESRNKNYKKTFLTGKKRVEIISNLSLVDLKNDKMIKLKNIKKLNLK